MYRKNILFVCSRNKRRSLTAEIVFKNSEDFAVKSCGTSPVSRVKINEKLIQWADLILVMEKRHREIIQQQFEKLILEKDLRVLSIPDNFELMDEQLIKLLKEKMKVIFFENT